MITSFDSHNTSNDQSSKILNKLKITQKNSKTINYINNENEVSHIKNNTLNGFCTHYDLSLNENNLLLNKTMKIIKSNNENNNTLENNELEENSNLNNNLSSLIKDINFNNLNEYYELQSSIFMKKIQKLNLKFYWTSEVLLTDKNIQYPYNKLFLILFKEISLYIDEIERLNKQLKLKNKNENYYTQKISQLTQKEKNNMANKQMLRNMQRNYYLLQKTNEKFRTNIEKLNKKLNYYANTNKLNKNIINNNTNNECKSLFGNQTMVNTTLDSLNTPNSLILNSSKISKKVRKKIINKKNEMKNSKINDIIKSGINQCDEEIKNLTKIEELLLFKYKKKSKKNTRYNSRNKVKLKILNKTLK